MTTMTNWEKIQHQAGPNTHWPGRKVYLFSKGEWLRAFRVEAEQHGCSLEAYQSHLYILVPA
jgi:hypothetical protein